MKGEPVDAFLASDLLDATHDRTAESLVAVVDQHCDSLDFTRPVVECTESTCTDRLAVVVGREVDRRLVVLVDLDLGVDALLLDEDRLPNGEGVLVNRLRAADADLPLHSRRYGPRAEERDSPGENS